MFDFNLVLNLFTLAMIIVFAVPVLRSKRKDAIIAEQTLTIESHERRLKALEQDLHGAQERANEAVLALKECETTAAEWQARYDEQAKYTAAPAIENFEQILLDHQNNVAERHRLMINSLNEVTQTLHALTARLDGKP